MTPVAYPYENSGGEAQAMEGNGVKMAIFTRENGFVEESGLGYHEKGLNRLNSRYVTFIAPNKEKYRGKRVLDLASHDGRWSFAALKAGAAHVTGIEYRQDTIDKSRYIIKDDLRDSVRFIQGDIFEQLQKLLDAGEKFDVVQCFGIFYHVMDHHRLLRMMTSCGADLITIDTSLIDSDEPIIKLKAEPVERFLNAAPVYDGQESALVGVVSRKGIEMLAEDVGYKVRYEPWLRENYPVRDGLWDYFNTNKWGGRRYTFYLEKA
jgi:predicted RNA methylase